MNNTSDFDHSIWLRNISQFGSELFQIGSIGESSLTITPKIEAAESREIFGTLPESFMACIEFLQSFYQEIGSSLILKIKVKLPSAWAAPNENDDENEFDFFAHLEIVSPEDVIYLYNYNMDRFEDVAEQRDYLPNLEALAKILPPGTLEKAATGRENFRVILGECLMFCKDDVGGGIAYYGGQKKKRGIYSLSMHEAHYVTDSMAEFFGSLQRHLYHHPISETKWDSFEGDKFLARLARETIKEN